MDCWIINISDAGARLDRVPPVPSGTLITLLIGGHPHAARVAWSYDRLAGVRFEEPLGKRKLDYVRGLSRDAPPSVRSAGHHGFREMR